MIHDLEKILKQIHELNEYELVPHNLTGSIYYVYKLENVKVKDLENFLRHLRPEHARFDVFINGQYIPSKDYVTETISNTLYIKFIKENIPYTLDESYTIKVEGDLEKINE